MTVSRSLAIATSLSLGAQTAPPPTSGETATSSPDVIVNGYPIRCHPRPNDPADLASAQAPTQNWYYLVSKPGGGYRYEKSIAPGTPPEDDLTRLDRWRRAGDAMPSFVFRQPVDGSPSCIGRRAGTPSGAVQLQQQIDPTPYRCRFVRFMMFAASRKATATIWMNAGAGPVLADFSGNHGWTPVRIERGPVGSSVSFLGFGVLARDGDLWFYQPRLEIIPDVELTRGDRIRQVDCQARRERLERNAGAPAFSGAIK